MRKTQVAVINEVLYMDYKGESQRAIEKSLGISRNSIRKYLKIARKHGYGDKVNANDLIDIATKVSETIYKDKGRTSEIEGELKPVHKLIEELLQEKYMTHKQIHRKLDKEHNIQVNIRALNRYINKHFQVPIKSTVHLETVVGEEAQVDYGYAGLMHGLDGNLHKTYLFVMTLSHSRHRYVEFVQSQNEESWCQSHINAFEHFGAVPKRIILDNLKAGVIKAHIYDPVLNIAYQELSRFYNFIVDPAKARKPEHKGKVERSVLIAKQQLLAGCDYSDINHSNECAKEWSIHQVGQEICLSTGKKPYEAFIQEDKPSMICLPEKSFDIPQFRTAKVHKNHHVSVLGNYYSVPTDYIGQDVSIRLGLRNVEIYHDFKLIKTHIKLKGKGEWSTDQEDYHVQAKKYLDNTPEVCLKKAKDLNDGIYDYLNELLRVRSNTNLRKAQMVLRLVDIYGEERVGNACIRAFAYDNYEANCIKNILEKDLDSKGTQSCANKVVDINVSAYIRSPNEYSSSMEVNYG